MWPPLRLSWTLCVLLVLLSLRSAAAALRSGGDALQQCNATFASRDPPAYLTADDGEEEEEWRQFFGSAWRVAYTWYCPAHCASIVAAAQLPRPPVVYGQYPYHGNSSICLASIHSGLVDERAGGVVFLGRFYPVDWSNTSTGQTVFPHSSYHGSDSHGVRSVQVPAEWHDPAVPSSEHAWSYTVKGRGDLVSQRRVAPFSPRAGHLHVSPTWSDLAKASVDNVNAYGGLLFPNFHLILGGHNATHYMNDVWLHLRYDGFPSDWSRLPDAPFSPRSDMVGMWTSRRYWLDVDGWEPWDDPDIFLWVLGGQTGHACGLYELGVCSDEVWQMRISFLGPQPVMEWTTVAGPLYRLPFPGRCGAAPVDIQLVYTLQLGRSDLRFDQSAFMGLAGGQLSYNDTRTCSTPPITVNEVCVNRFRVDRAWNCTAAPFSPRRSMQRNGAFIYRTSRQFFYTALAGGLRYTGVAYNASTATARLTSVEMWSESWACWPEQEYAGVDTPLRCVWGWNGTEHSTAVPQGRLPLVMAMTPSKFGELSSQHPTISIPDIGGLTSRQSVQQWKDLRPLSNAGDEAPLLQPSPLNTSLLVRLLRVVQDVDGRASFRDPLASDVELAARGLPASVHVGEEEVNDPTGYYQLGMDWIISHARPDFYCPQLVMAHQQAMAFATEANQSTPYLYQPASSANTTRPLFNFPLRRLGHGQGIQHEVAGDGDHVWTSGKGTPNLGIVSGGRSGSQYSNDWIELQVGYCPEPMDPSFAALLGPVEYGPDNDPFAGVDRSYLVSDSVILQCVTGYHWEPTTEAEQVSFYCGPNLLWVDVDISSVRRCVRDAFSCPEPFVFVERANDTDGQCEPPRPFLTQLAQERAVNQNNLTLTGYPVQRDIFSSYQPLEIDGRYFRAPVEVNVGGRPCLSIELGAYDAQPRCLDATVTSQPRCYHFASHITCALNPFFGHNLPVEVVVGVEKVSPDSPLATISSTVPIIYDLQTNGSCAPVGQYGLHQVECPIDRPFQLLISLRAYTLNLAATSVSTVWLDNDQVQSCVHLPDEGYPSGTGPDVETQVSLRYLNCTIYPRATAGALTVHVRYEDRATLVSETEASLSWRQCEAGSWTDFSANGTRGEPICVPCQPGYSTVPGLVNCQPCRPGYYAPRNGTDHCIPCLAGHFQELGGADHCTPCPCNAYTSLPGSARCEVCDQDRYITPSNDSSGDLSTRCVQCPPRALCSSNGNVTAYLGTFINVDSTTGRLSTTTCSPLACLSPVSTPPSFPGTLPLLVPATSVVVNNHCAAGRYPAYSALGVSNLADDDGLNLLCAHCLPGHSQVNGRCIPCSEVNWPALLGVLVLATALVYCVHRFPHDWTGSATLTIVSYFLQQSMVLVSSESVPQLLSLLSVDLLGDSTTNMKGQAVMAAQGDVSSFDRDNADVGHDLYVGVCVVPLTDVDRLVMQLTSPLLALFILLAVIGVAQLLFRCCLTRHRHSRSAVRVYEALFQLSSPRRLEERGGAVDDLSSSLHQPLRGSSDAAEERSQEEVDAAFARPFFSHPTSQITAGYVRSIVRLVQLSYTPLSLVSLSFFSQDSVGEYGWRLTDYPTISTHSSAYRTLLPVMCLLLGLFVCGLPLSVFAFLFRAQRRGAILRVKAGDAAYPTSLEEQLVLQLCASFKLQYWWLVPFSLVRRALIVAVLIGVGDSTAWVWVTATNNALLVLHLILQPYERTADNQLETTTLLSLSLQSTVLSAYPPPFMNAALLATLILLIITPLLPLLATSARGAWARLSCGEGQLRSEADRSWAGAAGEEKVDGL